VQEQALVRHLHGLPGRGEHAVGDERVEQPPGLRRQLRRRDRAAGELPLLVHRDQPPQRTEHALLGLVDRRPRAVLVAHQVAGHRERLVGLGPQHVHHAAGLHVLGARDRPGRAFAVRVHVAPQVLQRERQQRQ
jgi:hypothetical protein